MIEITIIFVGIYLLMLIALAAMWVWNLAKKLVKKGGEK
jgi:hypothetical protein